MSRNNDTYMSSLSDDLFLNYNGFNNIKKSTSHIIKNKKNDVKLCDLNKYCIQFDFDIKNKNIFNNSLDFLNSDNNFLSYLNVQIDSSDTDTSDTSNITNTTDTTDTTDTTNTNIIRNNNISTNNIYNTNINNNHQRENIVANCLDVKNYYVKNKYDNFKEVNSKEENTNLFKNDYIQELLNYHVIIIMVIIILMIYFLRK